jgi:DNA-directed RNA polymerase specialized sigma24 family protein
MAMDSWPTTSWGLLRELVHAPNQEQAKAWTEFVRRYSPPILRCWRRWESSLRSTHTREDFCQIVLVKLFAAMKLAEVRRWIKKVLSKCVSDLAAAAVNAGPASPEAQLLRPWAKSAGAAPKAFAQALYKAFKPEELEPLIQFKHLMDVSREMVAKDLVKEWEKADPDSDDGCRLDQLRQACGGADLVKSLVKLGPDPAAHPMLGDLKQRLADRHQKACAREWPTFRKHCEPVFDRALSKHGMGFETEPALFEILMSSLYAAARSLTAQEQYSFRGWLGGVIRNAAIDCVRQIRRIPITVQEGKIKTKPVEDEFVKELVLHELRERAESRVRDRVKSTHWQLYWLKVHEEFTSREVADQIRVPLGTVDGTVKRVKSRVQKAYRDELRREAERSVRKRVKKRDWQMYRLMIHQELTGQEVAERVGVRVSKVALTVKAVKDQVEENYLELQVACGLPPEVEE